MAIIKTYSTDDKTELILKNYIIQNGGTKSQIIRAAVAQFCKKEMRKDSNEKESNITGTSINDQGTVQF